MKFLASILATAMSLQCLASTVVYDVSMRLRVPRVFNNSASLGERRYQTQKIVGTMSLDVDCASEPAASFFLTNLTHKVGGRCVTYKTSVSDVRWHAIGSNAKGTFNKPSVCLSIESLPSYVPTFTPTDDETLVLVLSGAGTEKRIHGYAAGSLGCGCSWYGHVSPTRLMWTDIVVDTASVWGSFTMKRK